MPSRPVAEIRATVEKCKNVECRLLGYQELFRGGVDLLSAVRDVEVPCGAFAEEGCPSMPWCLSLLQGTYQVVFEEQSDVVWVGRNAESVKAITIAAEKTETVDGTMLDGDVGKAAARLDLAAITLSRDAERWREVPSIGQDATHRVQDLVPIENCVVVYADACAGRIGSVCAGAPWWNSVGAGGLIPVELDLESPSTRRALAHGRAITLD